MKPRSSKLSRRAFALATLLLLAGGGQTLAAPAPRRTPEPLPRELVAAWTEAGATAGWMKATDWWLLFRRGVEGREGEVPAFQFRTWTAGVVGRLPQPRRAFGLLLDSLQVTDEVLEELAGLKELQWLCLNSSPVKGAGLKALAGLKGLHHLALHATDEGMKGVARMEGLQWLWLNGSPVTDAGLKELAGLTELQALSLGGAKVTGAGVAELQKALPTLNLAAPHIAR